MMYFVMEIILEKMIHIDGKVLALATDAMGKISNFWKSVLVER